MQIDERDVTGDAESDLPSAASDVLHLGSIFMPQVVQLQKTWNSLFMDSGPAIRVVGGESSRVSHEKKAEMVMEVVVEMTGGFIEICRQRLQEEALEPAELLVGLKHLMAPVDELHELVPHAKLQQRASRVAEALGERELDRQLQAAQDAIMNAVVTLQATNEAASVPILEQVQAVEARITSLVREALVRTSPLVVPLCELLSLRPDGMAKHLVKRLYSGLLDVSRVARQPTQQPSGMILRAGLCLQMVGTGVAQVRGPARVCDRAPCWA